MKCWYCYKETMVSEEYWRGAWYKCTECGATWIEVKKLRLSPVIMIEDAMLGYKSPSPRAAYPKKRSKK